ncbi:MAG TPA: Ig-like domain-containing protein [Candidatus Binatia bacterium]|nr:Ig-like domain-containing protein [Candidatus Binatia bacterium]
MKKTMRNRAFYIIIAITLILPLLVISCRREPEPTPTVAATVVAPQNTPTRAASQPTATSIPPTATREPEIEPIRMDPADIDWAPQVVYTSPNIGQEAELDGAITVRFDQAMDKSSVQSAFAVEDAGSQQTVRGEFEWPQADTLTFTPQSRLQRNQRYQVQIGETARSENGQSLERPVNFTFQTVGFLEVAQVIPADGVDDIDPDNGITVFFNRPVVPLVSSAQQGDLPQPLEIEPPVEGSGRWVSTSIYRFTAEDGFAGATEYEVTIPAGLEDVTGGVLQEPVTWQFTTAQPSVAAIEPANGATEIIPTEPLTVTFNMRMDRDSVESAITLSPAHAVEYEWLDGGRTVVLQPEDHLQVGTEYTLSVGASAAAASGQATLDHTTSSVFQTVPLPSVEDTTPVNGTQAPPYQFGISIQFASPMNPDTIEGRIQIDPAPAGEIDSFISPNGRYVNLGFELERNTRYTVTIPGDVADPYGNTLGDDYTWSFTTSPLAPLASLNLPPYISQLSDDFPTEVTIVQRNVGSISAALYDADLPVGFLLEPGRVNDFAPGGSPLRAWNFEPSTPLDTAGEITFNLAGERGTLPTGIYLLTLDSPAITEDFRWWQNQRELVVVAGTNLVVKETFGAVHVWATDLATGQPLPDQRLALYNAQGSQVGTATTNGDGLATFDYKQGQEFLEGVLVVSGAPGEAQFGIGSSNWDQGVAPWAFDLPYATDNEQPEFAYIYTDRPIYRPGDTVHYRGIVREANYARYGLPERESVQLRVEFASFLESDQTVDYETTVSISPNGTFGGEYVIPEDAPLGQYRIFLDEEGAIANATRMFTVADYRNPEFMVTVTSQEEEALRGEAVDVVVEARYFFGAPAADLPVSWTIRQMPYYFPWDGPYYSFNDDDNFYFQYGDQSGFFGDFVAEGSGRTDENGRLVVSLPADLLEDAEEGSRQVTVEATIRDLSEFPVSATGSVVFHAAETYVGVAPEDYLNSAGSEASVNLITVDWNGDPVGNQDVEVIFYERDYEFVRDSGPGSPFGRWEPEDTEVERIQVTTDASGEAQASFVPEQGGTYRALASVSDGNGRTHRSSVLFWVSDADFVAWRVNPDEKRMDLTPDQRTYEVGDTARILVQSPFVGPVQAWLTIERGTVLEQRLITLESNSEVVEIPISQALTPNAFVTIVAVRGADSSQDHYADIRLGIAELVVPPQRLSLNIQLTPRDDVLAPGETVTYDIHVTNYAGEPEQAELSLALVDLAVLTLKEDNAPPIVDAFYAREPYRSRTGSGLFVSGEGREVEIPQEQLGLGGGGGGGAAEEAPRALQEEDDVRRDFPDTAFWQADLMTDENGEATVDIPLPDSVTTWRLSSKAVTGDSLVGQTSVDIVATLPLLIRPVTPRFLTVNDRVQLGAIVNNNTSQSLDVDVTLEGSGVTLSSEAAQSVTIPANGQQLVRWQVTVDDVTHADLTFRAQGGEYSDATKPTFGEGPDQLIPVYRYDAEDLAGTSGVLDEAGRQVEAILVPPEVDPREGSVQVTMSPSLAAAMTEALQYVDEEVEIESACAHAVVNKFLPNLVTVRALRELGLEQPELEGRLDDVVQGSIARLAALQMADGGWGWCFASTSNDYLTAYVLFGLAKAQEAGYDLAAIDLDRALRRLTIRDPRQIGDAAEANRQAWFLYVRAELQDVSVEQLDALFEEHRDLLDPYAQAYLALAYEVLGAHRDANQETLLADLSNNSILSATGAHWEDAEPDWFNLSSDIRGTAVIVDALARIEPDNAVAPQAVRWLMSARTANHWPTSFETAWSILALTDWMVASGELKAEYAYSFSFNGLEMEAGNFDRENVTEAVQTSVPMRNLVPEEANFLIFERGEGDGRLYYTAHLDAFVNAESVEAVSRGATVERVYYDAECDPEEFVCEPIDSIEAGQRVRVQLTLVAPTDLTYVRLEDAIPAGAEAVDPGLLTSASGLGGEVERVDQESNYRFGYWGWWYFDRIEYRDEKVVFYSNFLPAGSYQYTYYLETTIPGEFQVRPAIAHEEFFPEVFGRSDGARFTITNTSEE